MGYAGFDFKSSAQIFREYASLTAFKNEGTRAINLNEVLAMDYDNLVPFQWGKSRMFADGKFFTVSGRANFIATPYRPVQSQTSTEFPLVLNTGRIRDQWHTITRTGKSARLTAHMGEPFAEIHPEDAAVFKVKPATLITLNSPLCEVIVRANITKKQKPGSIFALMHWSDMNSANARSIICACNNVGRNTISIAISQGAATLKEIGAATKAGISCGSCRAELKQMLSAKLKMMISAGAPELIQYDIL